MCFLRYLLIMSSYLKKIVYRYINMQYCILQMHFAMHRKMLHCSVFCKGSSDLLVHLMGFFIFLLYHKNFIFKSDFCHHGFNVGHLTGLSQAT